MTTYYSQSDGNATTVGVWNSAADGSGSSPASFDSIDDCSLVIQASHNVCWDGDTSGWANGIQGITINGGVIPGMLYCKYSSAGTYYIKIKSGYTISGTTNTNRGRLLANNDGVWANAISLPFDCKFIIEFLGSAGTAKLDASNLDIKLYDIEPSIKSVRTYGIIYKTTDETALSVDDTTDTFTRNSHGFANNTPVMVDSTVNVPSPLIKNTLYWVVNSTTNTFKLAQYSGGTAINLTDNGSGTVSVYSGHSNTSTAILNTLDDVTGDSCWLTTTGHNRVVLANAGPVNYDQQRTTLATITATAITLSENVNSAQHPGARIYLVARNICIKSNTTAATNIIDYATSTFTANVHQHEVWSAAGTGTTFYGNGVNAGTSHTISGTISGCNYGVNGGTSHTISGTISGCAYGMNAGISYTISGTISGCSIGVNGGTSHTISGTISGCSSGVNAGTSHTISGTISGCNYGVNGGTSNTISGTISGCSSGVYVGTSHTISGTISGCAYGMNVCTSHTISGTISGCSYGVYRGTALLFGTIFVDNGADLSSVLWVRGFAATLGSTVQCVSYKIIVSLGSDDPTLSAIIWDIATAGVPAIGQVKAWMPGGYVASGTPTAGAPVTLAYSHKHTFEVSAYPVYLDVPLFVKAGIAINIPVYVKQAQTGQTETTRVQLIDPDKVFNSISSKLFDQECSDSTDWQTITITYIPAYDRQLILRVIGRNNSGSMEWMFVNTLQPSYIAGRTTGYATLAKEIGLNAYGGSGQCAKLTPTSTSSWGYWDFYVEATASTQFILSFYHKISSGWNGLLKVSIYDTDSGSALLSSETVTLTDDGVYHKYSATAVTPTSTGLCRIRVEIQDGASTGLVYIDNITIT